jgi:hypothetical protein
MRCVELSKRNWEEDVDPARGSGATAWRMGDSHPGLGVAPAISLGLDSFCFGLEGASSIDKLSSSVFISLCGIGLLPLINLFLGERSGDGDRLISASVSEPSFSEIS